MAIRFIRQHAYNPGYAPEYDRLLATLHLAETATHNPDQIQAVCASTSSRLYLGFSDARVASMATLILPYTTLGHRTSVLEDVAVLPDFQGQKIGAKMLDFVVSEAIEAGAERMELHSNAVRVAARAMYASHGFKIIDTTLFRINLK
jgi:ribosomal protein S18 acetylase RimI-like enzyme